MKYNNSYLFNISTIEICFHSIDCYLNYITNKMVWDKNTHPLMIPYQNFILRQTFYFIVNTLSKPLG